MALAGLGRPRFAPSSHLALGFDFSRVSTLPLSLFVQYGGFSDMPHSVLFPVLPHVTLALSARYTFDWSAP